MAEERERGRVRWWKDEKGYGRITAENGDIMFCHFSFIEGDGYKKLTGGQVVEYVRALQPGPHGPRWTAQSVRTVEE